MSKKQTNSNYTHIVPETEDYSFKVELSMYKRVFFQRYSCKNLETLFNLILDEYPKAKIISIIGG